MTRRAGWVGAAAALLLGFGVAGPARAAAAPAFERSYSLVQVRVSLAGTQIGLSRPISGGENRFIGGAAIAGYQYGRVLGELSLGFWQRGADHALRAGAGGEDPLRDGFDLGRGRVGVEDDEHGCGNGATTRGRLPSSHDDQGLVQR